jgi:hypothetical protein
MLSRYIWRRFVRVHIGWQKAGPEAVTGELCDEPVGVRQTIPSTPSNQWLLCGAGYASVELSARFSLASKQSLNQLLGARTS